MSSPTEVATTGHRLRRLVECGVFVAVWIALGYALRLEANAYLLLGIPLTVLFDNSRSARKTHFQASFF